MIHNSKRGETAIELEEKPYLLCLTLGSLAELETAFDVVNFQELETKLINLNARNLLIILAILLKGGGNEIELSKLKSMKINPTYTAQKIGECFSNGLVL